MDFGRLEENLKKQGYGVHIFDTKEEAAEYLNSQIDGKTVGIGGCASVDQMQLFPMLATHNEVTWHGVMSAMPEGMTVFDVRQKAIHSEVYIASVNGIAETGEIVNIDGTGNRVAALSFGPLTSYLIIGENKVAPDLEGAIYRARNIAAPKNAQRLSVKTPCAVKGDKCYDCDSPARICRNLSVFWKKPTGMKYEIILVHEELGF